MCVRMSGFRWPYRQAPWVEIWYRDSIPPPDCTALIPQTLRSGVRTAQKVCSCVDSFSKNCYAPLNMVRLLRLDYTLEFERTGLSARWLLPPWSLCRLSWKLAEVHALVGSRIDAWTWLLKNKIVLFLLGRSIDEVDGRGHSKLLSDDEKVPSTVKVW